MYCGRCGEYPSEICSEEEFEFCEEQDCHVCACCMHKSNFECENCDYADECTLKDMLE